MALRRKFCKMFQSLLFCFAKAKVAVADELKSFASWLYFWCL